jgi:hypothetical protein
VESTFAVLVTGIPTRRLFLTVNLIHPSFALDPAMGGHAVNKLGSADAGIE